LKITGRLSGIGAIAKYASVLATMGILLGTATAHAADQWLAPTPDELAMTSIPGYPNAPAVILLREEITKDDLHVVQHYQRIKVLTEKGKDYANVELRFASSSDYGYSLGDEKNITDVSGRTIHPDGTIIPFTGKPYLKMMEKGKEFKYQARVFTLPDVEVGSIIEYRYNTRIDDNVFEAPNWYLQDDLFIKNAHFMWYPTIHELSSSKGSVNTITWFPILPAGVKLASHDVPAPNLSGVKQQVYEVSAQDIAPQPDEEYMPPIRSLTYRVLFAYSPFYNIQEYWKSEGKQWSKGEDSFIGPDGTLKAATGKIIAGAQTQDEKLRKIYAAVMALENTSFTRDHAVKEDQAAGVAKVSSAGDAFKLGRGNSHEMVQIFVGMARAAGMKSYMVLVPDRSKSILTEGWMSFSQFDNEVAIVNVDGKEQFFDPGQRDCPYGQLAWENTFTRGLRQTDSGTDFAVLPGADYKLTTTLRIADLSVDSHGELSGPVTVTYTGSTALQWRQRALNGDEESLKTALRTTMESLLPKTLEVKFSSIDNLSDYEKPLVAHFEIKGAIGTPTGKRMILPGDIFVSAQATAFPHEKREIPVYFQYPQIMQDAVRIKFPSVMSVEAAPASQSLKFGDVAQYNFSTTSAPGSITVRRNSLSNFIIVPVKDYGDLRAFYSQIETKDQDSVVLKVAAESASAAPQQ
jgi:hypothetical protein